MISTLSCSATDALSALDVASRTVLPLLGVILGGWLTQRSQVLERRVRNRERIRDSYADWMSALESLSSMDSRALLIMENPQQAEQMGVTMSPLGPVWTESQDARHAEEVAFAHLMLNDTDASRVQEAQAIRNLCPFKIAMDESPTTSPSYARFLELGESRANKLGSFAIRVANELSSTA